MNDSAIIMMVFGLLVTWGGAAVCLFIAIRSGRASK
ncbi:MAG: MetS family NSS transporter small subunit [Spirochaetota bacterium]